MTQRFRRSVQLISVVIVGLTLVQPRPRAKQSIQYPPAIRPTHPTIAEASATDLGSPYNAWDNNISSGAGNSFTNICKFVCTAPTTRMTEWYGFQSGWIPRALVIRWEVNSTFANMVSGSHGQVHATLV
jgi:hypothetical protein